MLALICLLLWCRALQSGGQAASLFSYHYKLALHFPLNASLWGKLDLGSGMPTGAPECAMDMSRTAAFSKANPTTR